MCCACDFRVPAPFELPRARIHREQHVPSQAPVQHAVGHQRRPFHSSTGGRFGFPGPRQAQPAHVRCVNLLERTVVGLGVIAAISHPLVAILCGVLQSVGVDTFRLLRRDGPDSHEHRSSKPVPPHPCRFLHKCPLSRLGINRCCFVHCFSMRLRLPPRSHP